MSIEEVEALNPHFRWCKRKVKRLVRWRANQLAIGSMAWGCRGHPGIVVKKYYHPSDPYGADVEIKSLVDGIVEGCSIFHCAPQSEPDHAFGFAFAEYCKRHGMTMATIKFYPNSFKRWEDEFFDPSSTCSYVKSMRADGKTVQDYLGFSDIEWNAYKTGVLPE